MIRAIEGAKNSLLDLEELEEKELDEIRDEYIELAKSARYELKKRRRDPGKAEA